MTYKSSKNYSINLAKDESESFTLSLFLNILIKKVIKEPTSLVPYTEEMSSEISDLLSDVTIE
ncbi:hypothetical protein [Xenococcus sp. PCC 7305]|uniref:hypothetical protein n=1 Tax=Xenococcus sp. PCC 7305 TaxID=102125 RepID=UPI00031A16A6|nr:hypothetical protein [Xenococcus sp. PCC 7305]